MNLIIVFIVNKLSDFNMREDKFSNLQYYDKIKLVNFKH